MASLPSLADLADVEDRLGRDLAAEESRRADALLRDASAVVRSYCRRDFTMGTTTGRMRPVGNKVTLPLRPVLEVTGIWAVQSFGTTQMRTPISFWNWPGGHEVYIGDQNLVINGPTLEWDDRQTWLDVEYRHGFAEIPEDIVTVVANLVAKNLTVPAGGLIDMETVGPYNVRYATYTSAGPLGLSEADRQILNRYRSTVSHTVELRS